MASLHEYMTHIVYMGDSTEGTHRFNDGGITLLPLLQTELILVEGG